MGIAGGDSGSPLFVQTGSTTIQIAGIVWAEEATGGSFLHDKLVASPFGNITSDVGMPTFTYY